MDENEMPTKKQPIQLIDKIPVLTFSKMGGDFVNAVKRVTIHPTETTINHFCVLLRFFKFKFNYTIVSIRVCELTNSSASSFLSKI